MANLKDLIVNGSARIIGNLYANLKGNAESATKLETGRTIRTNLGSTTAVGFDGTANIQPGVTGTLPVANGGTGQTSIANIQAGKDGDGNTISSTYVHRTGTEEISGTKKLISGCLEIHNNTISYTDPTKSQFGQNFINFWATDRQTGYINSYLQSATQTSTNITAYFNDGTDTNQAKLTLYADKDGTKTGLLNFHPTANDTTSMQIDTVGARNTKLQNYLQIADQGTILPNFDLMTPVQTVEFDISDTSWHNILTRTNTETLQSDLTDVLYCRITVTGTNIKAVHDCAFIWKAQMSVAPQHIIFNLPGTNDANLTGMKYIRHIFPKALNNGYNWYIEVAQHNNTARHWKIEVFKTNSKVTWLQGTASAYNSTYHNVSQSTIHTNRGYNTGDTIYGTYSQSSWSSGVNGWYHKFLNTNTTSGEALLANQFVYMNNNKTYPATNKTLAIEPGFGIQLNVTAYNANVGVGWDRVRTKGRLTSLTNIPHATLTAGNPCYFRCTTNSNGNILSDNYVTNEMTAGYTWYYIGIAESDTIISIDTTQSFFITLDSSGKVSRINGKPVGGSGGSGSSSRRVVETFTATANQTTFTLTNQVINKDYLSVNVDNVELTSAAYSLASNGLSVTLGTGVAAGAKVDIKYFTDITLADSGATFTPSVSKSGYTTTMSWSNDRSLPNPSTVTITDGVIYTPSQTKSGSAAVISWTNNQGKTNPANVTLYDGVTFTPSVSVNQTAQTATLSWTNDGGKTNPNPVTIYLGNDNTTQRYVEKFTATANQKVFVATHDIQAKNVLSVNVDNSELLNDGFTLANDKRTVTLNDGCAAGAIVELKYFHNLIMAQDGNTYTPHVSKSNYTTTLSWTNDGGLTNPSNVNILDGVIWTPAVTATTGGYNLSWTNNQGKTNPSTVFINGIYPAGVWASASTYKPGYMVTYEDTNYQYGYIAKQNVPAGTALTNTTYWVRAYAIGKTYVAATIVDWGE